MESTEKDLRIDVPFYETSDTRDIHLKEAYLTLSPKFIRYKIVANYESKNDDTDIWKEQKTNWRFSRKKEDIAGINMIHYSDEKYYSVEIDFCSFSTPLGWKFNDPKEGLILYNLLLDYFETTNNNG